MVGAGTANTTQRLCIALRIATRGLGKLGCGIIGAAAGGLGGGIAGGAVGEGFGDVLYEAVEQ